MEAPDKIYLERSLSFPDKFHRQWYKEDVVGNGEEYIRKGFLLEWAKDMEKRAEYKFDDESGDMCWGYEIAIGEVIEKLESL